MAGMVSEDVPEGVGPSASLPFGQASQVTSEQKALQSQTGSGQPPPGAAPPQPQQPQPQQQGPQASAMPTAHPPIQPAPLADPNPRQPNERFNPESVFSSAKLSAMPGWRERLSTWASHPDTPMLNVLNRAAQADPHHDAQ